MSNFLLKCNYHITFRLGKLALANRLGFSVAYLFSIGYNDIIYDCFHNVKRFMTISIKNFYRSFYELYLLQFGLHTN